MAATRAQRAQQQQQMQAMAMAQQGADTAKSLADSKMDGQDALSRMLGVPSEGASA